MIGGKKVLGLILARGGSKRVPGKNVRMMAGRPMVSWTVAAGLGSQYIDRLVLSTDDDGIMQAGLDAGCEVPFRRPAELATDGASAVDAVLHALKTLDVEGGYLVLLQPTSPLRNGDDIDECISACHEKGSVLASTVTQIERPAKWLVTLDSDGRIEKPFDDNQADLHVPNGLVYVADIRWFLEHKAFWVEGLTLGLKTPLLRSVDVDSEEEFLLAEAILLSKNKTDRT